MKNLIEKIDKMVYDVKNDSNRTNMVELWVLLLELSKIYWEAKQEYIRAKNEYDRETVMKMESWKTYLERHEDTRYKNELATNPKAKKNKITNVEVTNSVELELIGLKDKVAEAQMTQAYLDPITRWFYEIVNLIKFTDRENTKQSFNTN